MAKSKILISLLTDEDTQQIRFGDAFLRPLFSNSFLKPEFASNFEPINNPVGSEDEALPYWIANPFFCRRKKKIASTCSVYHTGTYGSGALILDAEYVQSFDWMALFQQLVVTSKAHYGYLHLITDQELNSSTLSTENAHAFFLGAFSKNIGRGFADLAWANFFGARWMKKADLSYLAGNCARCEPVLDGHLICLTPSINDLKQAYPRFDEAKRAIKRGFCDGFFTP